MPEDKSASQNSNGAGERHVPVLLHEALDALNIRAGLTYVDATAGAGGHLKAILSRIAGSEQGAADATTGGAVAKRIFGIDRDEASLHRLESELGPQASLIHANYRDIKSEMAKRGITTIDGGILADLGVSSMQIDDPARGFSFLKEGPLDMRMDHTQGVTAATLVNTLQEDELAEIIFKYGEDRLSRRIARAIVKQRPLKSTLQLADVVARCVGYHNTKHRGHGGKSGKYTDSSHPATRTFQALRIAVNEELTSLEKFLDDAIDILAPGARLAVITFHSLEDRLVKQILRRRAQGCLCPPKMPVCTCHHEPELLIITRKPIVPGEKEILANIRSRSAKLRAGEKL